MFSIRSTIEAASRKTLSWDTLLRAAVSHWMPTGWCSAGIQPAQACFVLVQIRRLTMQRVCYPRRCRLIVLLADIVGKCANFVKIFPSHFFSSFCKIFVEPRNCFLFPSKNYSFSTSECRFWLRNVWNHFSENEQLDRLKPTACWPVSGVRSCCV